MKILKKKDRRKYLSAPALNKMNNEVYVEGERFLSDHNSRSSHSMSCTLDKNLKKERRKSFIFYLTGSSTNEKSEFSFTKSLNLDIKQRTWNSSLNSVHNDQANIGLYDNSYENEREISQRSFSMTQAHSVSRGPTDPDGSAGAPLATKNFETSELIQSSRSSKARQKKFHRHFKQVGIEEKVLNYYSCALVGDILLQGHLYITENFFAFYSNVFGYVTKLLIPTVDVLKISKEKTAKIIPNAVGISTEDEKHVFGSLLSRDSTYKFMLQVWKAANNSNSTANINSEPVIKAEIPSDEDSSGSSGNEEPSSFISNLTSPASSDNLQQLLPNVKRKSIMVTSMEVRNCRFYWNFFKMKTVLYISLVLLIFLVGSAGFLLYRIVILQNHFNDMSVLARGNNIPWRSAINAKSVKISEFLQSNLNEIIKIRLNLEALLVLTVPENSDTVKSSLNSKWKNANVKSNEEIDANKD